MDAVYPTTSRPSFRGSLNLYGSWLGSDKTVGSVVSRWFRAEPHFKLLLAGYESKPGNRILIEVSTSRSQIYRLPVVLKSDPRESWVAEEISLETIKDSQQFRVVAVDGTSDAGGWIGFSDPFLVKSTDAAALRQQSILLILATALSLVAFISPGLILRQKLLQNGRRLSFVWIAAPGLLIMAVVGLVAWLAPSPIGPRTVAQALLSPLVLYALFHFSRRSIPSYTSPAERRVLLTAVVLTALGVAKSTYSLGPVGELYQGTISRTLEVGGRSDSRIPYHVVQLVATRSQPYSSVAFNLFSPYNFSHRGPLASLAASPIVLASPVRVPATMPDQAWTVFDPEGFAAYRTAMIVIACCSLMVVFGIARLFLSERWALLAFLVTATSPFVIHEIYFTWPKLEAASFVLLTAYQVFKGRYFQAGLALGIGYLCHPLALLYFPALALLGPIAPVPVGLRAVSALQKLRHWVFSRLSMVAGLFISLFVWRIVNREHYSQSGFLAYFRMADNMTPTIPHWLQSRFDSLANTLLPLNVFLLHRAHSELNSISGPSPALIQFFLQYWVALPFGIGIAFFFCLIPILYRSLKTARAGLIVVVLVPLACFAIYWGAASTGLLREGLQPWFLGLAVFSVVVARRLAANSNQFWILCNAALLFRGVEVLLMLLLPSIWSQHRLVQPEFRLTDTAALLIMIASTLWLCFSVVGLSERLRRQAECKWQSKARELVS